MAETIIDNKACTKADQWRARIAEQERSGVEIVFAGGEQLRIRSGVDGATLRIVIEALRA